MFSGKIPAGILAERVAPAWQSAVVGLRRSTAEKTESDRFCIKTGTDLNVFSPSRVILSAVERSGTKSKDLQRKVLKNPENNAKTNRVDPSTRFARSG